MASKKKKKDAKKLLRMAWGDEILVLDEDSRFFICKDCKFRKTNPMISEVLEVKEEKEEKPDGETKKERGEK